MAMELTIITYSQSAIICRPMLYLLKLFHGWVGSWGAAGSKCISICAASLNPVRTAARPSRRSLSL